MNLDFDLFDPQQTQNAWEFMRECRNRNPVARIQGGFVLISRYEDACLIFKDGETFSNEGGMRPTGTVVPTEDASIGELPNLIHPPLRKLASIGAQGGGVMRKARPFVRECTERLLDAMIERGSGDLIADYSLPLTNQVIAWLLGVPMEDSEQLAEWGEAIMRSTLTVTNETERGIGYAGAFPEFTGYLESMIRERINNKDAPEDTITRIVRTGLERGDLSIPIIRMVLLNLMLGGTATTRDFIGSLLLKLMRDPDLHRRLRADRALIPLAIEESLRLAPPVLWLTRICTRETDVAGETIHVGERVVLSIASANRDEEIWEDADAFRLDRQRPAPHLSFGLGAHFCVGAPLARMEGEEAIGVYLDRFAAGQVHFKSGFELEMMPLPYMLGPLALDVEISRDPAKA